MQISFKLGASRTTTRSAKPTREASHLAEEIIVRSIVGLVYALGFWFVWLQGTDSTTTLEQTTPMLHLAAVLGFVVGFVRGGTNMSTYLSAPDTKGGKGFYGL